MRKALLIHGVGFAGAIPLSDKNVVRYVDAIKSVKNVLSSEEFVNQLIEDSCLEDDLFQGYSYKFVECFWHNHQLIYRFKCDEENLDDLDIEEYVEKEMITKYITIFI